MKKNKELCGIAIDEILKTKDIDEIIDIENVLNRKIFINDDIEDWNCMDAIVKILRYNNEDDGIPEEERKPIRIYITSNGGSVNSGIALMDTIAASKTPVYTVNLSYQYSMACIIGIAGSKRFAMPNAKFLIHDGSDSISGSTSKVMDFIGFAQKIEDRIMDFIIGNTRITKKEYKKRFREEWYFFADEAKECGVIDYIIGQDVDIDEIM